MSLDFMEYKRRLLEKYCQLFPGHEERAHHWLFGGHPMDRAVWDRALAARFERPPFQEWLFDNIRQDCLELLESTRKMIGGWRKIKREKWAALTPEQRDVLNKELCDLMKEIEDLYLELGRLTEWETKTKLSEKLVFERNA